MISRQNLRDLFPNGCQTYHQVSPRPSDLTHLLMRGRMSIGKICGCFALYKTFVPSTGFQDTTLLMR